MAINDTERLARAVLLFYKSGRWGDEEYKEWIILTGKEDATSRSLCDFAREVMDRIK